MPNDKNKLAPVPAYLQRIEQLAEKLERHNQTLDLETRADIGYLRKYAEESRRVVEVVIREQSHSYSRAEICNGTGFARHTRFIDIGPGHGERG